jgi:AraC family transcriptional regulator
MEQPPLDHHYIVMHLGGAKKVVRSLDGPSRSELVERGSLTFVPAGTAFRWETTGPIAFAHLYLRPGQIAEAVERATDRDGRDAALVDGIGIRDALIESLFRRMLSEIERATDASPLRLDSALHCLLEQVAARHSTGHAGSARGAFVLAPHKLRRTLDYVESNLAAAIGLDALSAIAGTSQSHFCHGFRAAMGISPYRYVLRRRIALAKALLLTSELTLQEVGASSGFASRHQFSLAFKAMEGIGPKRYRMDNGRQRESADRSAY